MKIPNLIRNYEQSVNAIVKAFCQKQDTTFEFWVNDKVGGICLISDNYFNFKDILWDMETEQPKGLIFEWCNYCVENKDNSVMKTPSYKEYITTKPMIDNFLKEINELIK